MKKLLLILSLFLCVGAFSGSVLAQKPTATPPAPVRDPLLEADAKHNLEVAQQYFRSKKAYKAVLMRFEETFAAYPEFSKMDEFLYLAGMSSYYLSQNKGKQKVEAALNEEEKKKYAPEKLREESVAYLSMIIENYPQSSFRGEAEKTLKLLKQ